MSQCLCFLESWEDLAISVNEGLKLRISTSKQVLSNSVHSPQFLLTDPEAKGLIVAIYSHAYTIGISIFGKYFLYHYLLEKLKNKRVIKLTHCF